MKTAKLLVKLFLFIFLFPQQTRGQISKKDSIVRRAAIQQQLNANKVRFSVNVPPLRQIAGAPKAYYSNFWEFGDGHYSKESNPSHTYRNKGEYTVRLAATNNYDDGLPPTSRPKKITITDVSSTDFDDENNNLIDQFHGFRLLNNREPSPNQEMQFVLSYANVASYTTQGKLYVFFNEKKYKKKNFNLLDVRAYYGERSITEKQTMVNNQELSLKELVLKSGIQTISNQFITENDTLEKHNLPATLKKAKEAYYDYRVWEFDNLLPNEARNLFMTFKTTPEMLKDTTAVISIRSVFVPEIGSDTHQVRTKEMEIVTSHDPNKMAVYNTLVNYRLMRYKRLKYKVRFQNNGEGPARLIKLNVTIPEMLDKSTLKVVDMYPKVPICPDGESVTYSCLDTIRIKDMISFQFNNIYLPGSNQKGVQEKDSTKGFVKYSLKFGKKFHKRRSKSKTAIIFDKNEPIITNTATSRFSTGLSIGVRAGYNYFLTKDTRETISVNTSIGDITIPDVVQNKEAESFFIGATFSPYKSYRWYFQAEAYFDRYQFDNDFSFQYIEGDANGVELAVKQTVNFQEKQTNLLFVPASARFNINSIFALGAGVQVNLRLNGNSVSSSEKRYYRYNQEEPNMPEEELVDLRKSQLLENDLGLHLYDYMPFVDMTAGISRIGPSVGVRCLFPLKEETNILQFYAIWKF